MDGRPASPAPLPEVAPCLRVLLTVWAGEGGRWIARAEGADGSTQWFHSPFELARFVARAPPRQAGEDGSSGLR